MTDINRLIQEQNEKTAKGPTIATLNPAGASVVRNVASFTVSGVATGGDVLAVTIEGEDLNYTTVAAESAADAATNAAAAWQIDLDAAYSAGEYTVTAATGVITFTKTNGTEIWVESVLSSDTTQTIQATDGYHEVSAILYEQTVAGTGQPKRFESGWLLNKAAVDSDLSNTVIIDAELVNGSGGAASARWRVWLWYHSLGWVVDQEIGIRTISEPTGSASAKDVIAISAPEAEKIAIELVDNGSGGNLAAGAQFSSWAVYLKNA